MAAPENPSTERDEDMTQDVVPAGSVFALEVREHHEFEEEEFSRGEPPVEDLPERPFNKMERTSDYVFHLPEEHDPEDPYPWEDRRWQGDWIWNRGGIGRAEAYFWFVAMTHPARLTDTRTNYKAPRELRRIRHVAADRFDLEEARERMSTFFEELENSPREVKWFSYSYITRLLRPLLRQDELLELLFEIVPGHEVRHFFVHLMPPEDPDEAESLQTTMRKHLETLEYKDEESIYTGIRLLERLPDDDEAERLVRAVIDFEPTPTMARDAVNVFHDPARFAHWFAEVPEYELAAEETPYVFGKGRYEVIEALFNRVVEEDTSFQMTAIKDLVRIHSHRAVKGFLDLYDDSAVGPMAHAWLTSEGANAIKGLLPLAMGRDRLTHVAQRVLREYRDRGHAEVIDHLATQESTEFRDRVRDQILEQGIGVREELPVEDWPDWMADRLARKKPSKRLPDYIDAERLPPLVTTNGSYILPQKVVNGVINRIVGSRPDSIDELIPKLRDFLEPRSRHNFVWYIFERWREHGAEARQKFCMWALGFLGTDESGTKLLPYLDEWTEERAFYRATWALDVYRCLGTDASLTMLHRVAQRARSRQLRDRANEVLDDIATERGLSRAELDDRVVPMCGLNEEGKRVFDFGPRQVEAFIGEDLEPQVTDEDGETIRRLPTMRDSDNPAMVATAREEWKLFTRQLRETIDVQGTRLEQAMVVQRRWKFEDFKEHLIEHPIMKHLARRILWGGFSNRSELAQPFYVTDDGEFLDAEGEEVDVTDFWRLGIVHPLYLDAEERVAWGTVFADNDIETPFDQLDRHVFELNDEEKDTGEMLQFNGQAVDAIELRSRFEARGWRRDKEYDQMIYSFDKRFGSHNVSALLKITPGMSTNWEGTHDPQAIEFIHFFEDDELSEEVNVNDVSPIVISEIALDLKPVIDHAREHNIVAKQKEEEDEDE